MAKTFHLTIAKLGENLFDGEAMLVTLPGADGDFTVMAAHEAFVTPLRAGTARVKDAEGLEHTYPIESGIAEVSGNQATVLL
jgi:F-type H+-transporting ATPase subunit epsilon